MVTYYGRTLHQIAAIANRADYAIPVSGPDTSRFAVPEQSLMGIDEDAFTTRDRVQANRYSRRVQLADGEHSEF